jgi:hypothetical protein
MHWKVLFLRAITILAAAAILFTAHTTFAAPSFVQRNCASPQIPQTSVILPYRAGQQVRVLNVVIVGWNDTTAQVSANLPPRTKSSRPRKGLTCLESDEAAMGRMQEHHV